MGKYRFQVVVKPLIPIPEPAVQVWVDRNGDGYFSLDEDVALENQTDEATGEVTWTGEEELPDASKGPLFSAAIVAASGSKWSITITNESGDKTYESGEHKLKKNTLGVLGRVWR